MPSAAKTAEAAPDRLDVYRLRDDLAHSYNPANAHERMLVTQIAQAWQRLQQAYDLEQRYFAGRDVMETIATKLEEFKAVTRFVTDCDRAWRHAYLNLEKSQRRRQRADLSSPNARRAAPVDWPPATAATRPSAPPLAPVAHQSRE